jgi:hypothetical protein
MEAIEQIAELNNWATVCIDTNRMGEALNSLQSALQLSKSHLNRCRLQQHQFATTTTSSYPSRRKDHALPPVVVVVASPQHQQQSTSSSSSPICRQHQHEEATMMDVEAATTTTTNNNNNEMIDIGDSSASPSAITDPFTKSFEVQYREPIQIYPESFPSGVLDLAAHSMLTAIIVFNLALVYDLAASESSRHSSSSPKAQARMENKAKFLYEQVLQLYVVSCMEEDGSRQDHHHPPHEPSVGSPQEDTFTGRPNTQHPTASSLGTSRKTRKRPGMMGAMQDLVAMAAVNNLFHSEQEDESRKDMYVQMLLEIAKIVDKADYGDTGGELRRLVNWQGGIFLLNAFFLKALLSPLAAAAA